jgi:hypothetical protein
MRLQFRVEDERFLFSFLAFCIILIIGNQFTIKSVVLGICGSVLYFLIGGYLTGGYLLDEDQLMVRVALGALVLLAFMGLVGWVFIIFRGLGAVEVAVIMVAAFSFLLLLTRPRARRVFGIG